VGLGMACLCIIASETGAAREAINSEEQRRGWYHRIKQNIWRDRGHPGGDLREPDTPQGPGTRTMPR
jgi:hypothetical protein